MPELYAASVNPPRRAKRATPVETNDDQPIGSTTTTTTPSSPRALLPMRPYAPRTAGSAPESAEAPPPPAKRGRKPGPLSRTAREAQRRLNHSIIEKARRTKINDALAALKQLVPANYGKAPEQTQDQLDEEDDNDEDYEEGKTAKSQPTAGKGKGKKEEKEKEFKLEILIRTVSFLQDLLQRVDVLEAAAAPPEQAQSAPVAAAPAPPSQIVNCPSCNAPLSAPRRRLQGKKRKRAPVGRQSDGYSSDYDDRDDRAAEDGSVDVFSPPRPSSSTAPPPARRAKIARRSTVPGPSPTSAHGTATTTTPQAMGAPPAEPRGYTGTATPRPRDGSGTPVAASARLPPISAWLECVLDPQLPGAPSRSPPSEARRPSASPHLGAVSNGTSKENNNNSNGAYLPSPPNSTRFAPERTTQAHPPFLSLGPVATAALVGPPASTSTSTSTAGSNNTATSTSARTPEDESAASLLLQIAASPPFRAVRSASFSSAASASSAGAPPTPTQPSLSGGSGTGAVRGGGKWPLADPSGFSLQGAGAQGYSRAGGGGGGAQAPPQVQTPSSLLGLDLGAVGGPLLRY